MKLVFNFEVVYPLFRYC